MNEIGNFFIECGRAYYSISSIKYAYMQSDDFPVRQKAATHKREIIIIQFNLSKYLKFKDNNKNAEEKWKKEKKSIITVI